jgi:hypothetical protein
VPDRVTNICVLVEDREQQNLVRRFLQRWRGKNYVDRRIRWVPLPAGSGAGERYVRVSYPVEARALRSSLGRRVSGMLVVMLDADRLEVAARQRQLADELVQANTGPRDPTEPIFVFVPKRHVETWIRALLDARVDEGTDYKRPQPTSREIETAATTLCAALGLDPPPDPWPPSLRASVPDWRRLPR